MLVLIFAVITVDNHRITCQLFANRELALSYTQGWLNAHGFSTGQVTRTGDTWMTPTGTIQIQPCTQINYQ